MEINILLDEIQKILKIMNGNLQIEAKKEEIADLEHKLSDSSIWNNPSEASKLAKQKDAYEKTVSMYDSLLGKYNDVKELLEMSKVDSSLEEEVMSELIALHKLVKKESIICIFSEEADQNNCFIEINAGAGGTEAQDWTEILSNMYIKWAEKNGYSMEVIDRLTGDEAGIKNICMKVKNKSATHAYGWLKFESGVHRLVRISPFDSSARRHTSFASVWVYPEVNDNISIEINEKDLRIDTYRASGAGGQHVNKTDSAIRITHLPTNIVVQCQEDRSQHKNRATAMKMLQSRLYKNELDKKMQKINEKNAAKKDIEWGSQIRSYVLQPYQMVKDVRTGMEKGDAHSVLNGDITEFLEKALEANLEMND
jgi:peptide chain release factor 2